MVATYVLLLGVVCSFTGVELELSWRAYNGRCGDWKGDVN